MDYETHYVTYYIYINPNVDEPLHQYKIPYNHQTDIEKRLKEIRELGYFYKADDGCTEYYPPTSIHKVAFITSTSNE